MSPTINIMTCLPLPADEAFIGGLLQLLGGRGSLAMSGPPSPRPAVLSCPIINLRVFAGSAFVYLIKPNLNNYINKTILLALFSWEIK